MQTHTHTHGESHVHMGKQRIVPPDAMVSRVGHTLGANLASSLQLEQTAARLETADDKLISSHPTRLTPTPILSRDENSYAAAVNTPRLDLSIEFTERDVGNVRIVPSDAWVSRNRHTHTYTHTRHAHKITHTCRSTCTLGIAEDCSSRCKGI